MMATPHLLAGAALGRALRRPWLVYPAALASHFVLDIVPHLDSHSLFGAAAGGPTRAEAAAGLADFAAGALLVGALAWRERRPTMFFAALVALVIDLVEYVPPMGPWFRHWPAAAAWVRFHHDIQYNVTRAQWPLGVTTQAAVMATALVVSLAGRRARAAVASS